MMQAVNRPHIKSKFQDKDIQILNKEVVCHLNLFFPIGIQKNSTLTAKQAVRIFRRNGPVHPTALPLRNMQRIIPTSN